MIFSYAGCGGGGSSGGSSAAQTAPAQVTTPAPSNGANMRPINQQLGWAAASGADYYDVYFAATTATGWTVAATTTTLAYNPGSLTISTTYYWRIDSRNDVGTTTGTAWMFTTDVTPVLTAVGDKSVNENILLSFAITGTDADLGDTLAFSMAGTPTGSTLNPSTGLFSWTPGYTQAGTHGVTFRVTDAGGLYDEEAITMTVTNVDRAPVLTSPGNQAVNENSLLSFTLSASDPDSDTPSYSMAGAPTGSNLISSTGVFSWTPGYTQSGSYPVTFTATTNSLSDAQTITIAVTNVDRAPVLTSPGAQTVILNQLLTIALSASDPDSDVPAYSMVFTPSGASLNAASGVFTWTPSAIAAGVYGATFTATTNSLSDSKYITVTVSSFGAAAKLLWVQQPTSPQYAAQSFSPAPVIRVTDVYSNTVTSYVSDVAITLTSGTGLLSGETVAPSDGVATFPALQYDKSGAITVKGISGALTATSEVGVTVNALTGSQTATTFTTGAWSNSVTTSGAADVRLASVSLASPTWLTAQAPDLVGHGGAQVSTGDGNIYAFRGNNTTAFWRYSVTGNSWTVLTVAPAAVLYGGALAYPGTGDFIYGWPGSNSTAFWRYSISGNSWTAMTVAPGTVSRGAALVSTLDDYIYAFRGDNGTTLGTTTFWRYSISGNSWSVMAVTPASVEQGGALCYPGTGNLIYGFQGNMTNAFWAYSISGDSWSALTVAPDTVWHGGSLTSNGGDYIYGLRGGLTTAYWRYSISGNSWTAMATMPNTAYQGASICYPGSGDSIFVFRGSDGVGSGFNTFWNYSIAGNSWETGIAAAPVASSFGGCMAATGSDYIYYLPGGSTNDFRRYSIAGNSWATMAVAPNVVADYAAMAYPGSGNFIYVLREANPTNFWRYSISGNSWATMAEPPDSADGTLVATGDDYIYAFLGNTTGFYRYSISGDSWTAMAVAPGTITLGCALGYAGGDYIYAFKGTSATGAFWRYSISGDSWTVMTDAPAPVERGSALAYPGAGDFIYAFKGNNTVSAWRYSISGDSWPSTTSVPAAVYYGGGLTAAGDFIYGLAGNNTTGFWRSRVLNYVTSGVYTTTAIAPTGTLDQWGVLTFTASAPANTTVTVDVLQSSDDSVLLTDVASGTDISGIGAVTGIKLRFNFSTTNITATPVLSDWTVNYTYVP